MYCGYLTPGTRWSVFVGNSDQNDISGTNDYSKVRAITDQLAHLVAYLSHQKAVLQGRSPAFCSLGDFLKGALIQTDDTPDILFEFHLIIHRGFRQ